MIRDLLRRLSGNSYGAKNTDASQQDREVAILRHRLAAEAIGLQRVNKIAARTSLFNELIEGRGRPHESN